MFQYHSNDSDDDRYIYTDLGVIDTEDYFDPWICGQSWEHEQYDQEICHFCKMEPHENPYRPRAKIPDNPLRIPTGTRANGTEKARELLEAILPASLVPIINQFLCLRIDWL
jgi:hypothetical protein